MLALEDPYGRWPCPEASEGGEAAVEFTMAIRLVLFLDTPFI